ncbi:hypothetical protein GH714_013079 [Hevea brasiliensis]|uniref:Protein kinase domain-containing protein n=1 Tax=Hevea brasiliensis TaxID=3981 RepID=A0A6A6NAF1_HEVBR|nr:hypothetical protein GH714_013079 [Hevea brasiliensis]
MAVKSAEVSSSSSLQKEKEVFHHLRDCPYILECYGEETNMSKDEKMLYNLLLEYASGGTLADLIKRSGGKTKKRKFDCSITGTAFYMAPETLVDNIQEFPYDIWAPGCMVFEMFTGKSLWGSNPNETTEKACERIADRYELPKILSWISKDGKNFLKGCLVKNHQFRFTIEMLLIHPFVSGIDDTESSDLGRLWIKEQDNNFSGTQSELKRFGHGKELNCRYDFLTTANNMIQVSYLRPKKVLSMGQEDANSALYGLGRGPSLVMSDFIQNVTVGFKNKRGIGIHLEKLM